MFHGRIGGDQSASGLRNIPKDLRDQSPGAHVVHASNTGNYAV